MNIGQSKPETVSVRIREDDYAAIREIGQHYGVKNVDVIQNLLDLWGMLDKDDQDMVFLGGDIEDTGPDVIFKTPDNQIGSVTYKIMTPQSPNR